MMSSEVTEQRVMPRPLGLPPPQGRVVHAVQVGRPKKHRHFRLSPTEERKLIELYLQGPAGIVDEDHQEIDAAVDPAPCDVERKRLSLDHAARAELAAPSSMRGVAVVLKAAAGATKFASRVPDVEV